MGPVLALFHLALRDAMGPRYSTLHFQGSDTQPYPRTRKACPVLSTVGDGDNREGLAFMKFKPWWIGIKIAGGLGAAATLSMAKFPDKTDPVTNQVLGPAFMGVAQADWVLVSAVFGILMGVILAADATATAVMDRRQKKSAALEKELSWLALGLIKAISDTREISITHLGASVFAYRKPNWRYKEFKLEQLLRYRLDKYPARSGIKWVGNKGAIGKAAASRAPAYCDWVQLSKELTQRAESDADVLAKAREEDRFGFSDEELVRMARNYYESLAVPVLSEDGRNVIGVLAIDVPNRNSLPDHEAVLDADVKEVAVTTAEGIARLLKHDYNAS